MKGKWEWQNVKSRGILYNFHFSCRYLNIKYHPYCSHKILKIGILEINTIAYTFSTSFPNMKDIPK